MELHELLRRVLLLAHDIEKRDPAFQRTLQNLTRLHARAPAGSHRLLSAMLSSYGYQDVARCQRDIIDRSGNIENFERLHNLRIDSAALAVSEGESVESSAYFNLTELSKLASSSQALEVVTAIVTCTTYFSQLAVNKGAVQNALS